MYNPPPPKYIFVYAPAVYTYSYTLKYSSITMCRLKCINNNENNTLVQWF